MKGWLRIMLYLYFGEVEDCVDVEKWYDNQFDKNLLMNYFSKVVLGRAGIEILGPDKFRNEFIGIHTSKDISTSVKIMLYLMYGDGDQIVDISYLSEKFIPNLRGVGQMRNVNVCTNHMYDIYTDEFGKYGGEVAIVNSGVVVTSSSEYFKEYYQYYLNNKDKF